MVVENDWKSIILGNSEQFGYAWLSSVGVDHDDYDSLGAPRNKDLGLWAYTRPE